MNTKTNFKSDYINFDTAKNTALTLLSNPKKEKIGLYILTAIYSGLRTGDIQSLTWEQLENDSLTISEEKTNKLRTIDIHPELRKAINKTRKGQSGLIFISQKNSVYTTQALNRILKDEFKILAKKENISTHSLRKTFGRRVYDMNGQSESSLILLSEMFSHSNIQVTRIYLGLKKEEFRNVYLNL